MTATTILQAICAVWAPAVVVLGIVLVVYAALAMAGKADDADELYPG